MYKLFRGQLQSLVESAPVRWKSQCLIRSSSLVKDLQGAFRSFWATTWFVWHCQMIGIRSSLAVCTHFNSFNIYLAEKLQKYRKRNVECMSQSWSFETFQKDSERVCQSFLICCRNYCPVIDFQGHEQPQPVHTARAPLRLWNSHHPGETKSCRGLKWDLPSSKLTVRPCQIGVGRLVSTKNWWFSGSMLIYWRVFHGVVGWVGWARGLTRCFSPCQLKILGPTYDPLTSPWLDPPQAQELVDNWHVVGGPKKSCSYHSYPLCRFCITWYTGRFLIETVNEDTQVTYENRVFFLGGMFRRW